MANYLGSIEQKLWLGDFTGSSRFSPSSQVIREQGATGVVPTLLGGIVSGVQHTTTKTPTPPTKTHIGVVYDKWDDGDVWFDFAIVRALIYEFGNILSTQTDTLVVYSSYRSQSISLDSVVNNLGVGFNLLGLPSIPTVLQPQSGFQVTLEATTDGSPVLNDTIDFVFSVSTTKVLVTGKRIVMFPIRPVVPLIETLEFITDVQEHIDGSEKRISIRTYPRQSYQYKIEVDSEERQFVDNLLYDWQSRVFGLPVWTEPSFLTLNGVLGEFSIAVDNTTLGDYRVGGLVIILTDRNTFDALEVASITPTSIVFTSPLNYDYPINTQVFPLRTVTASGSIRGSVGYVDDESLDITFKVIDNGVGTDFADSSVYNTHNTKILLDDPNASDGRMTISLKRRLIQFDNAVGRHSVTSPWSRGKKTAVKGFVSHNRTQLWAIRRLLHSLRGKQTSFYMPTFFNDLSITSLLSSGSQTMNVVNVGFTRFAKSRTPTRGVLRVLLHDGTILTRNIQSSGEVDSLHEQIIVDVPWPTDIIDSEIARIEYIELVRADTDKFQIVHNTALGDAAIQFPVITVFD